jgi:D-sedoheptulose 7-phosphate isomerase
MKLMEARNASETPMFATLLGEIAASLNRIAASSYGLEVERATRLLVTAFQEGRKLLVFGNGGSSADAQHVCGEMVGRFRKLRRALPAIALTANQAVLTAWANDYSYDQVFSRQIEAHGNPGDVAWGISTSGNSANVVAGLQTARARGLHTIALTGQGGGKLADLADVLLAVPLVETPRIQEIHLITYHSICAAVERILFP